MTQALVWTILKNTKLPGREAFPLDQGFLDYGDVKICTTAIHKWNEYHKEFTELQIDIGIKNRLNGFLLGTEIEFSAISKMVLNTFITFYTTCLLQNDVQNGIWVRIREENQNSQATFVHIHSALSCFTVRYSNEDFGQR